MISGEVKLSEEHTDLHWGEISATNGLITAYKDLQEVVVEALDYINNLNWRSTVFQINGLFSKKYFPIQSGSQ